MTTESLLFSLLRFVICEEKIDNRIKSCCEPERLEELYTLSKKHDLAHLAGYALEKLELPQMEIFAKFKTASPEKNLSNTILCFGETISENSFSITSLNKSKNPTLSSHSTM